ncbi:glycosyltransferase family 39 protein [Luteolibacter ambystomatis]|uniref:Glycosyltransferase family 39 protein n=1 Tax=Luteolibacter ambystomatis TaxID=2824561 RepID=A0A975G899_9BACT|nr:glycosyltransferase family 39 protein [Luteolibacter ambystomatis]QUE51184.1 glycosyltransferase family 39 protein [Luteolibacter ambystomatis]
MADVSSADDRKLLRRLWLMLAVLVACRLVLLVFAPHTDPSESRYAEISRKMVETSDWITPQFKYGVPFWAKPPLSMWMSALGIGLFGANEFGSRIFIFLAALAVLWLVAKMGARERDPATGLAAAVLLMGMPLFFYCSAAVMTDLPLLLGITMAMAGFRFAVRDGSRGWGYVFFLGLAVGLLAKGPLVGVLVMPPLVGWVVVTGRWRQTWKNLPWFTGTLLMLLIAVPWYVLAERKTPGFIDYFIVGEHWKRFTVKGWQGDLYGHAHATAPGMIAVFVLAGTFPWCLGFLALPFRRLRSLLEWAKADEGGGLYWMLWALWPVVFFLPARNIIATYPLPALPALAMLLAGIAVPLVRKGVGVGSPHALNPLIVSACGAVMVWALGVSLVWTDHAPKFSERELVRRYQKQHQTGDVLLYYGLRKFSAEFYAEGNIDYASSADEVEQKLAAPGRLFLACPTRYISLLPEPVRQRFAAVGTWGPETLYEEIPMLPAMAGGHQASTPKP